MSTKACSYDEVRVFTLDPTFHSDDKIHEGMQMYH